GLDLFTFGEFRVVGRESSIATAATTEATQTARVANLQNVVRGRAGESGIGVLYAKRWTTLTEAERDVARTAVADMDLQAAMAGGLVRRRVPDRSEADAAAQLARRALGLGPLEVAGHLPDAGAGGAPFGPIMGLPKQLNASWGGQLRRYQPGFV